MSKTRADDTRATENTPAQSLLEQEIPHQPEVLRLAADSFGGPVAALLEAVSGRDVDDWVVTGCGDSLFAGICAEVWFARLAGLRLRALHAMHLSRETYQSLTSRSVVLAVSHSGTTARVLEAARAARSRGAYVVAVTANPESELARTADMWIDNSVREERSNCRTASFQAVSLFMRMLAEGLASKAGREIPSFDPDRLTPYIEESRRQVAEIPESKLAGDHWIYTGSGLGLAVAEYGMAKAYEAATIPAHSVELEQMIHCEIFTVRPETVVVIISPAGRAVSRAVELAKGLEKLGTVTIAITDHEELATACTHALRLPEGLSEDDLPFIGILPLQWLALRLAESRGENPDLVNNKWVNRPLIDHSDQWGPEMYETGTPAGLGRGQA
ncbi:SIS domain-containing protein [Streptosporangium sp. NPDC087985]|uniref:SIS domain-containing protein n=1 Tax=Streptosporangium sp. NPDC087985 TaxID=3366196 RepID=UPI0037F715A5